MKKTIILLTTIALVFMGIGFLLSGQNQEDSKFEKMIESYFNEMWKFYPTAATLAGYHKYDNNLENLSSKNIEKRREALDKFNQEFVAKIDKFKLNSKAQIDHEIIVDAIDLEILDHDSLVPWEYNPLFYNEIILHSIHGLLTKEFAPLNSRLKNAEDRLKELPKFIKRAKENLKAPPQIFTETAIKQFPEIINFYRADLPKLLERASPDIKSKIQASIAKALSALEDYQSFLQNQLLPRSDGNFRLGDQVHRRFVRLMFKNSIPLDELIARAKADLNNTRREMFLVCMPYYKIMYPHRDLDQIGTQVTSEQLRNIGIKGVFDKIRGEHVSKDEFIEKIKTIADEIKTFLTENQLIDLPGENLKIEPMPSVERGISYTRLITPGAYETTNNYTFQLEPIPDDWEQEKIDSYLDEYNNFFLYFWTIRKVYPGQFVPFIGSKKYPSLLRNLYPNMPLIKGWPVYLEQLFVESGFGNWNLFYRFNQLKYYLRAAIDFILEFNIHEGSMTKEQAVDYMTKLGFQSQAEAERKWNHIALHPGDAAYTYVGIQEIMSMEKEYKDLKGDAFSQKEFRQKLLSFGAMPIRLLKNKILEQ